jgi:hypothetical protein
VRKRIKPGPEQPLRIVQREDVRRDPELVLVGLVERWGSRGSAGRLCRP